MKNKIIIATKSILLIAFSLTWFVWVQAEYEIITKPELRNQIPFVKGIGTVIFAGLVLLILGALIIFLLYSIIKNLKNLKQCKR